MADISKELYTISSGRYGIDIRQDIYDALKKINDERERGFVPEDESLIAVSISEETSYLQLTNGVILAMKYSSQ